MDTYSMLFDVCVIASGVYMLYCAYTGTGSVYKVENLKQGMEEKYQQFIRRYCWVAGVAAIVTGVLDYSKIQPYAWIMFLVFTLMVIYLIVMTVRFTDRKKKNHRLK